MDQTVEIIAWQAICTILLLALIFFTLKYIYKFFKKNNIKNPLIFLLLFSCGLASCSKDNNIEPALAKVKQTQSSTNNVEPLRFNSTADMDRFVQLLSQRLDGNTQVDTELTRLYNTSNGEVFSFTGLGTTDLADVTHMASVGIDKPLAEQDDPRFSTSKASKSLLPWADINTEISWDWNNGQITNVSSTLSGYTLGISYSQQSWQYLGYSNGLYTASFTYQVNLVMFVQGMGTVYQQQARTMYVHYNPYTNQTTITTNP